MPLGALGLSDSDITAWATVALAFVGAVGIVTGIAVSIGTLRSAAAARKATELQAGEVAVLEKQTALLQKQQDDAVLTAFPWLEATLGAAGERFVEGHVNYVSGSAPAWGTEVWARTYRGYFHERVGFAAPGSSRPFRAVLQHEDDPFVCPFSEFQKLDGEEVGWVGVTWHGPNYWAGRHAWRLLKEGGRYVADRRGRWFDEDSALSDEMYEQMEREQQTAAIADLAPQPMTPHPRRRIAELARWARRRRNSS